jgi:hypothetical protein
MPHGGLPVDVIEYAARCREVEKMPAGWARYYVADLLADR